MSDRWLNRQHDEIKDRSRRAREAQLAESQKQAAERNRRRQ